jgi:hypothetical protein
VQEKYLTSAMKAVASNHALADRMGPGARSAVMQVRNAASSRALLVFRALQFGLRELSE